MTKIDRLSALTIKTNIVVQSLLDEDLIAQEKDLILLKNLRSRSQTIQKINFSSLPYEQIRLTFGHLSYEDFKRRYDAELLKKITPEEAIHYQALPVKLSDDNLRIISSASNREATEAFFKERFQVKKIEELEVTFQEIMEIVSYFYRKELLNKATYGLLEKRQELCAYYVFSKGQANAIGIALFASLIWLYFDAYSYLMVTVFILQFLFLISAGFRFLLTFGGIRNELKEVVSSEEVAALKNHELPIYSVMIPLYKEPEMIANLLRYLKRMDYPQDKMDVMLLLEEDDKITINAARQAGLPTNWQLVIIPTSLPKTKPKACNYGLQLARGKYLTIYDAEDIPDPDQLKKAIIALNKLGENGLCVQAALNYFNMHENFITSMFTLEYCYWFDYILPGLDRFKMPMPLGGTSYHFKTNRLKELKGWDPFNTTEDADLGIRTFVLNLKAGIINSTTLEEANSRYWNWIRQRSRWLKGYMQTAIVYNRSPLKMLKQLGLKNWLSFQLLIAGTPLMMLINPLIWGFFFLWLLWPREWYLVQMPEFLNYMSLTNLILGNFIAIYFNMLGVFKRKLFTLLPMALLNPFYWLFFHSVAAYKALWQLFFNPFYWEKTQHGITQFKTPE